jgi:hypothetical protein
MPSLSFPVLPQPNLGIQHKVIDNSLKSEMANGCVVTRKQYSRQLHKFQLHWNAMAQVYLNTLLDFYQQVNGGSASFTWTDDTNVLRTVRFDTDIDYKPVTNIYWDVTVTLAEV